MSRPQSEPSKEMSDWINLAANYTIITRTCSQETLQAIEYMRQWLHTPAEVYYNHDLEECRRELNAIKDAARSSYTNSRQYLPDPNDHQ